jgi:2-C-methyl-D-erythritol 2,4-cyclodiphosphate synthase
MTTALRIGHGIDVHAFGAGDSIVLAGVRIAHTHGVVAHSDGDVVAHALCDALLGGAGLGDIGLHFPDSDLRWRGADSRVFVRHVRDLLATRGLLVVNVDLTVIAEAPRLGPHRDQMRTNLAADLGIDAHRVNIKATTTEQLGYLGRREGIACHAVALLEATSAR